MCIVQAMPGYCHKMTGLPLYSKGAHSLPRPIQFGPSTHLFIGSHGAQEVRNAFLLVHQVGLA